MDASGSRSMVVCAFDLDNTLYDFVDFFGPAFRGMISALSKSTAIAVDELIDSAKRVFEDEGFLEYPFLVRRMPCFDDRTSGQIAELEDLASVVFRRIRDKRLRSYSFASETLEELSQGGVVLAAVTNAPIYHAYKRLLFLGLVRHFNVLIGVENPLIPAGVRITARTSPWEVREGLQTHIVPRALGKPSEHPYKLLRSMFSADSRLFSIGDSVERDLAPAARTGYTTIFAKYGKHVDARNYETVLRLTPKAVVTHEIASSSYAPDYTIDCVSDVLDIIRPNKQLELF